MLCLCRCFFLYYEDVFEEALRWCIRWLPSGNLCGWLPVNFAAGLEISYVQYCEYWESSSCRERGKTFRGSYWKHGQQLRYFHLSRHLSREMVVFSHQLVNLIWVEYRTDILYLQLSRLITKHCLLSGVYFWLLFLDKTVRYALFRSVWIWCWFERGGKKKQRSSQQQKTFLLFSVSHADFWHNWRLYC